MPWKGPDAVDIDHPAYEYHGRVGEVSVPDGEFVGHVVVVVWTLWARVSGFLWWRRWGIRTVIAELQMWPIDAAVDDVLEDDDLDLCLEGEQLSFALDSWRDGSLPFPDTTYAVDWLSVREGDAIALERWGWDLPSQRQRQTQ